MTRKTQRDHDGKTHSRLRSPRRRRGDEAGAVGRPQPGGRRRHRARHSLREEAGEARRRQRRRGAVQRLGRARQSQAAQCADRRHDEGRHRRAAPGVAVARRGLHRADGERHDELLHRRQCPGARRVLRRQSAGIPPIHAAVHGPGHDHPDGRQAGDLPRQRHAARRRPGDRHGLRLLDRPGHGALRPGRPQARLGADRRRDRFPARAGRRRAGDERRRAVPAVLRPQGLSHRHDLRRGAGAQGGWQVRRPTHWSKRRA